jgi:hypothetical protein
MRRLVNVLVGLDNRQPLPADLAETAINALTLDGYNCRECNVITVQQSSQSNPAGLSQFVLWLDTPNDDADEIESYVAGVISEMDVPTAPELTVKLVTVN